MASIRVESLYLTEQRMRRLASQMLARFPFVRRWEETDDVLQEAAMRLHRALSEVTPESELHFHRLAALQVRRVLIDLARELGSQSHFAANHDTCDEGGDQFLKGFSLATSDTETSLDDWGEFHRQVGMLPADLKDVVHLMWYGGHDQGQTAALLGITTRSVQRRWRSAKVSLYRQLQDAGLN